ncbi:hypothetical protein Tco_0104553 [Tanacetum coccineum]
MKPKNQWTGDERKAANLDQRLKSLIMSILPDDQINFVINCLTAKLTWDDCYCILTGPSDVKESRAMDLKLCYNTFKFKEGESLTQTFTRYKALINELVNDGIKLLKLEIIMGFMTDRTLQNYPDDDKRITRSSQGISEILRNEYKQELFLAKSKLFLRKPINGMKYEVSYKTMNWYGSEGSHGIAKKMVVVSKKSARKGYGIISLEREINPRNPQHAFERCEACGSPNHAITDHYDIEWFKRGEALQAKSVTSGSPFGPKVVFGDDSTDTTKGYGFINCNGIVFTKKRGTIFNSNKEIVMIAPRERDVYVLDMTSSAQESCFFAKVLKILTGLGIKDLLI